MQQVRFEGSLLASLQELKAIEAQRLDDERAAARDAEQQREREREDAERRRREEAEARARAEHEARLAVEQARIEAEREARLRVEAAEAAERARQTAALEQRRLDEELALRRAEVARKRPTWMVAVTGGAIVLAAVLAYVALDSHRTSEAARLAQVESDRRADDAERDKARAREELAAIERESRALDGKIAAAIARLDELDKREQREAHERYLRELRRERAEAARRAARARAQAAHTERVKPQVVSDDCTKNAVCRPK